MKREELTMTNDSDTKMTYRLTDVPSGVTLEIEASDLDDAREQARDWAREGYDPSDSTFWVDTRISEKAVDADGDVEWRHVETVTVAIDPTPPRCLDRSTKHDWQSPHALVGGLEENPGVRGNAGGVIITEACMRCGCRRVTDTWAQRPDNGVQGLTSVSYTPDFYDVSEVESSDE